MVYKASFGYLIMQQQNTELYKWYIIHTHSGFEAKVINNIKEEIKKKGFSNCFEDFLVPTQKTLEMCVLLHLKVSHVV